MSTREQKRILLTGVAGFIGSHLLDRLLAAGHRVVGVDNLSMGKLENVAHQLDNSAFRFIHADITHPETLRAVEDDYDCIIHLAAFKIPRYGKRLQTLKTNYRGTENVLELARRLDCKCVLASTSDVYGQNPELPFHEESRSVIGSSTVARWSYAVSKLFDEHLAFAYAESYGIPVTVLRYFGSYGPRHHLSWWGGPQSVFISAILADREIPIHGDGQQTRSFTYVSDTVEATYAAAMRPAADGQIFNVGSTFEISILELARLIHRLCDTGRKLRLRFVPYESFTGGKYEDVRRRVPDVSRCREVLGVEATVDLSSGLLRTIQWQRQVQPSQQATQPRTAPIHTS